MMKFKFLNVKIHNRHPELDSGSSDVFVRKFNVCTNWIPAFAGMTMLVFFCLFTFVISAFASNPHPSELRGEVITYDIRKFGMNVGKAKLVFHGETHRDDQQMMLVEMEFEALGVYDRDAVYVDPETFYPLVIERDLRKWGKEEIIKEEFVHEEGVMNVYRDSKTRPNFEQIEFEEPLENIYSFIYKYRFQADFDDSQSWELHLPQHSLDVLPVELEELKLDSERFEVFRIKTEPHQYSVWFDQTPQKVPVRIDAKIGSHKVSMIIRDRFILDEIVLDPITSHAFQ